jgi:hypothetical protein
MYLAFMTIAIRQKILLKYNRKVQELLNHSINLISDRVEP